MSNDYQPPFAMLRVAIWTSDDVRTIAIAKEFASSSRQGLTPAWYASLPDVAVGIDRADFASKLHPFTEIGYEEGQIRRKVSVDENGYRSHCDNIDHALCTSDDIRAQNHLDELGYLQGWSNSPIAEGKAENWSGAIERSALLAGDRVGATEP
jgi:hypothetical protein